MDHSQALRSSVAPLPKDWNRRSGRPRQTWLRTVESDVTSLNIGNCLSSSTKLTGMEVARGNGCVHSTSHMMMMMMKHIYLFTYNSSQLSQHNSGYHDRPNVVALCLLHANSTDEFITRRHQQGQWSSHVAGHSAITDRS